MPCDAPAVAAALHNACKGFGTDEAAVWRALGSVRSQADWDAVVAAFRTSHRGMKGGDLRAALASDLSAKELANAQAILASNGVQWDAPPPAPAAPWGRPPPATDPAQQASAQNSAGAMRQPSRVVQPSPGAAASSPPPGTYPAGTVVKTMDCDGPCQQPGPLEVQVNVPRVVARTVVEPKTTRRTTVESRVVPRTLTEQIPVQETVMVPEPTRTRAMVQIETTEVQEVERVLKRTVMEPRKVTQRVKCKRPVMRTIETTETVQEMVTVPRQQRTTVMVPEVVQKTVSTPKMVTKTRMIEKTVMVEQTVQVPEEYQEEVMVPETIEYETMVPREEVKTVMVQEMVETQKPVTKEVWEMIEEEKEITNTQMDVQEFEERLVEPQLVTRTEMVPEERTEIRHVPRTMTRMQTVQKTVTEEVREPRTVEYTEMVTKQVQDHFEETRTLRFDPHTGEQLADDDRYSHQAAERAQPLGQPYSGSWHGGNANADGAGPVTGPGGGMYETPRAQEPAPYTEAADRAHPSPAPVSRQLSQPQQYAPAPSQQQLSQPQQYAPAPSQPQLSQPQQYAPMPSQQRVPMYEPAGAPPASYAPPAEAPPPPPPYPAQPGMCERSGLPLLDAERVAPVLRGMVAAGPCYFAHFVDRMIAPESETPRSLSSAGSAGVKRRVVVVSWENIFVVDVNGNIKRYVDIAQIGSIVRQGSTTVKVCVTGAEPLLLAFVEDPRDPDGKPADCQSFINTVARIRVARQDTEVMVTRVPPGVPYDSNPTTA